jgi:tRNA (cmo5U34)-methyltransferase
MKRDDIFQEPYPGAFRFDEATAAVFDDMVLRSVPLYPEIQRLAVELASKDLRDGSLVYDLGCSTGLTLLELSKAVNGRKVRMIGVDASAPMLDRAKARFEAAGLADPPALIRADVTQLPEFEEADAFLVILTLQFVPLSCRRTILSRIRSKLKPGGCCILVEKVAGESQIMQRLYDKLYDDLKRSNGYSNAEIEHKKTALQDVLIPCRIDEYQKMIEDCRFTEIGTFFRWCNFAGLIAFA